MQPTSSQQRNTGQSSSSSSRRPREREDAEISARSLERSGARLTPAPKIRKDPELLTLSSEDKDLKDLIITTCARTSGQTLTSWTISSEWGNLGACSRTIVCGPCSPSVKKVTNIQDNFGKAPRFTKQRRSLKLCNLDFKTSQTLPQNSVEFHYGTIGRQNPGTKGHLLRKDVHVFSDSVLCVGKTTPLQTRHGRQNSLKYRNRRHSWTSMKSRVDQCNATVTHFQARQRSKSGEKFKHSRDLRNRKISKEEFYSCRCSTTLHIGS